MSTRPPVWPPLRDRSRAPREEQILEHRDGVRCRARRPAMPASRHRGALLIPLNQRRVVGCAQLQTQFGKRLQQRQIRGADGLQRGNHPDRPAPRHQRCDTGRIAQSREAVANPPPRRAMSPDLGQHHIPRTPLVPLQPQACVRGRGICIDSAGWVPERPPRRRPNGRWLAAAERERSCRSVITPSDKLIGSSRQFDWT